MAHHAIADAAVGLVGVAGEIGELPGQRQRRAQRPGIDPRRPQPPQAAQLILRIGPARVKPQNRRPGVFRLPHEALDLHQRPRLGDVQADFLRRAAGRRRQIQGAAGARVAFVHQRQLVPQRHSGDRQRDGRRGLGLHAEIQRGANIVDLMAMPGQPGVGRQRVPLEVGGIHRGKALPGMTLCEDGMLAALLELL